VRFEPSGFTGNPEIPIAKSLVDYIFRWMGSRFLPAEDRGSLGLQERSQVVAEAPVVFGASALRPRADEGITAQSEAVVSVTAPVPAPAPAPATDDAARASASTSASVAPAALAAPAAVVASDAAPAAREELAVVATTGAVNGAANGNGSAKGNGLTPLGGSFGGGAKVAFATQADAPSCAECGSIMVRNGSCYKCLNCGSTSGCS
jgi:ribonucleoside-diphosphate reductase alpha chain